MWYSGHDGTKWSIGLATSSNGINWSKSPSNPVLSWSGNINESKHFNTPNVIWDDGTFKMWFTSTPSDTNNFSIGYATSQNGTNWTIVSYHLNTLVPSGYTVSPSVIKDGSQYFMAYGGQYNGAWSIFIATSQDGINWTMLSEIPVILHDKVFEGLQISGPSLLKINNEFHIWYNSNNIGDQPTNIIHALSSDLVSWTKESSPTINTGFSGGTFDLSSIVDPALALINDKLILLYGSMGTYNTKFACYIGVASSGPIPVLTPTLTPTPPAPIVIIPGMMASWNREEILEKKTSALPWKILPFVKEYDGIITTLKHLGYVEGQNLFIWPYDWRKSVPVIVSKLESYITSTVAPQNPGKKIQFIGHSLGGIVARAWSQSGTNDTKTDKIITAGSPHQGVSQFYKVWSGGELLYSDSLTWLAEKLILELNKNSYTTPRQTLQTILPVVKDLLPTSPYLRRQSTGSLIPIVEMSAWNTFLSNLNSSSSVILPLLTTLYGTGNQTTNEYTVTTPSWLDTALGNWTDGKPVSETVASGDGIVTQTRATLAGATPAAFAKNHSQIISSKESIDSILTSLGISHGDSDITPGGSTKLSPGVIFLMRSPATLNISLGTSSYDATDGIIFLPDPSSSPYTATIKGTDTGTYHFDILQLGTSTSLWNEYTNTVTSGSEEKHTVTVGTTTPISEPVSDKTLKQSINEMTLLLAGLSTTPETSKIQRALKSMNQRDTRIKPKEIKNSIEQILNDLFIYRKSLTDISKLNTTVQIIDKLISTYVNSLKNQQFLFIPTELTVLKNSSNSMEQFSAKNLQKEVNKGKSITYRAQSYAKGTEYLSVGNSAYSASNKAKTRINLLTSFLLFRESTSRKD